VNLKMESVLTALHTLRTQHVPNLIETFSIMQNGAEDGGHIDSDKIQRSSLAQMILYGNLVSESFGLSGAFHSCLDALS
jgi:hypothetical protein